VNDTETPDVIDDEDDTEERGATAEASAAGVDGGSSPRGGSSPDDELAVTPVDGPTTTGPAQPVKTASRRLRLTVAALAVLVLVLLAGGTLLGVRAVGESSQVAERSAVLQKAETVADDLTTIGGANAQEKIDALLAAATGDFRNQLVGYSTVFRAVLEQGKVESKGSVSASAVESFDADHAVVLVTVATTVTNTEIPSGQPRAYRLAVTMQRTGGHWLASAVDVV
jgi:Mce-associated membrane protein